MNGNFHKVAPTLSRIFLSLDYQGRAEVEPDLPWWRSEAELDSRRGDSPPRPAPPAPRPPGRPWPDWSLRPGSETQNSALTSEGRPRNSKMSNFFSTSPLYLMLILMLICICIFISLVTTPLFFLSPHQLTEWISELWLEVSEIFLFSHKNTNDWAGPLYIVFCLGTLYSLHPICWKLFKKIWN